jgi:DNA-binding CsgD family transcriptional regulator
MSAMGDVRGTDRSRMLRPGQPLGLGLDARVDEFLELLLSCPLDDVQPAGRDWLRMRYAEVVPLVLPYALAAVEHGRPLPSACLDALREDAGRNAARTDVDLSVALRAALPALRVFALVMHAATADRHGVLIVAMARASHVAHELCTCWVEAWMGHRAREAASRPVVADPPRADEDVELDLVARAPDLDHVQERMLALTAHGLSNDEIARATCYSRQAVAWHLGRLMRTWNAPNRTALVSVAFVRGVIRTRRARRIQRAEPPLMIEGGTTSAPPSRGDDGAPAEP